MRPIVFVQTGLFSAAVAVLAWWLADLGAFTEVLLISLCIGWSVALAVALLQGRLERSLGPWPASACVVALGLGVGLTVGGALVSGDPLYLFSRDQGALALGLFFAVNGFLAFRTRERLLQARRELDAAALKQARQDRLLAEAELKLLQARIEPHFLFNCLSGLTQLVRSDPDLAARFVENLSVLLRSALSRTRLGDGTLGPEADFARAYMEVQALRMQGRLRFRIDVPEGLRGIPCPPFLVQPLLENAVIHGIEPVPEGGEVAVTARRENGVLVLTVTDDGAGVQECGPPSGSGLRNVRERLRLRYGPSAALDLLPASPRGVITRISFPLEQETGCRMDGQAVAPVLSA